MGGGAHDHGRSILLLFFHLAVPSRNRLGNLQGAMAQQGAATDLYASPTTGLVHQLRQNPYVLGLASVRALPHIMYTLTPG